MRITDFEGPLDPERTYWAETDPDQAALSKKPYDDVSLSGSVEGRFIYCTVLGRHILPFALVDPAMVVLPVEQTDGNMSIVTAEKLDKSGYRDFAKWMHNAEGIWNVKRKEKANRANLYEWLDYQSKLSAQSFAQEYLVLYNAEGTNVAATFFDRNSHPVPLVVEHTVYWGAFASREEADYLCAILNSQIVNLAIKPFQAVGLLGERHIQKKLLELPIPTFEHENKKHLELSILGCEAREKAAAAMASEEFPGSTIAHRRRFMRTHLKTEVRQIDQLVTALLGG